MSKHFMWILSYTNLESKCIFTQFKSSVSVRLKHFSQTEIALYIFIRLQLSSALSACSERQRWHDVFNPSNICVLIVSYLAREMENVAWLCKNLLWLHNNHYKHTASQPITVTHVTSNWQLSLKTNDVTLLLQIAVIPLTPPPGCSVVNSYSSCCRVCLWRE